MNAIICATRYYDPFSSAHKGNDALFVEVIWQMVGLSLGIVSALVREWEDSIDYSFTFY